MINYTDPKPFGKLKTPYIVDITPENASLHSFFCIKNIREPGFKKKHEWFKKHYSEGLRMKILKDVNNNPIGFIEYIPAEAAWRPVIAPQYMFIHCMFVYPNKYKKKGYGSLLLKACENDAESYGMAGVCVITSKGAWIADWRLFEKNGFLKVDRRGRFELLAKRWKNTASHPYLIDWTIQQKQYKGWQLLYSDQCPWHEKSIHALCNAAKEYNIDLKITKISSCKEAKLAPSGFGVFNLLKDGRLLEDHYISETRFRNIMNKELSLEI